MNGAGAYDRRVKLRRRALAAPDEQGQRAESWIEYATVWGKRKDARAGEIIAAQQVNAEIKTVFTIRYRNDVVETDRMTEAGIDYDIKQITEIGRRKELELYAVALVQ